jgi:two-component system, OmpR family, aerobic respiration control sensor histidine kinase ArcB
MEVLLVEDDQLAQRSQQLILQGSGCHVVVATSAKQAVTLASQKKFDLIFMDIGLPELDGVEATLAIQSFGVNAETPVVALTAMLNKSVHQRCLSAGMVDVVVKPITARLLDQVREQIA